MASSNDPTPTATERRKRPRSPAPLLRAPELPSPAQTSQASTPHEAGSSQSSPEMRDGVPDVDGNARKRRRIHLVLVPEREIKEEEELFNSIVDYPSSPPAEANACVSTPPPPRPRSHPSAQTQQPTPPASHRSDTPFLPPTTDRGQQQPTPALCATTPPELPPTLTLSWPAEIVDAETYALAAASTQALIDHYLQNVARLVGFNKESVLQSATE